MEHLEEIFKIVGGLVFAVIYLFGNQIFKSRDPDEPRPPNAPGRSTNRSPASKDDTDAARERQIQETIRRKIMERRQAAATPADQAPAMMPQERRKAVMERQKKTHPAAPHVEPTREVVLNDTFSLDAKDNAYEQHLQTRLQEIEATKRQAEQLRRQIRGSAAAAAKAQPHTHRGLLPGSVRSTIRNPAAARRALVYGEVLGKPVSLRPPGVAMTD